MVARAHHQKRHGKHQKHTRPFLNVYHPYLPLLLLVLIVVVFFSIGRTNNSGVLAYATNISPSGLLDQTNIQRQENKELKLKLNYKLVKAAQAKADDMAKRDYWSHNTPDGKAPWIFIDKADYDYQKAGENLAYGFSTSANTVYAWMNSKPHRENILDQTYSEVGFGIANSQDYVDQGKETIVVAMYGLPTGSVAGQAKNSTVAVNSLNPLKNEPTSHKITIIDLFARGNAPWATSLIGMLIGAGLALLFIKHGLAFKRALKRSERFVVKHPFVDITVAIAICVGLVLISGAGLVK